MKKAVPKKRATIGDVAVVEVKDGVAHVQYVGKLKPLGWVIRVGELMPSSPDTVTEAVFKGAYFAHYPFPAALSQGLIKWVGRLPSPELPTKWRKPAWLKSGCRSGPWFVSQLEGDFWVSDRFETLTEEQRKLPIAVGWNHETLCYYLEEAWKPEQWV